MSNDPRNTSTPHEPITCQRSGKEAGYREQALDRRGIDELRLRVNMSIHKEGKSRRFECLFSMTLRPGAAADFVRGSLVGCCKLKPVIKAHGFGD